MTTGQVDAKQARPAVDSPAGIGRTQPPRQRVATALREDLLFKLDHSRGTALTIIRSPAGFGKTVLMAQWFERIREEGEARIPWLTLDENDRAGLPEVDRFVEQMIRSDGGVFAHRDRVALRVADLEAQGLVHRIRPQDLTLTLADTKTLLGPESPDAVVVSLHD